MAPLGYDTKDRKITVNEAEADRVRSIFRGYLKVGSLNLLMEFIAHSNRVSACKPIATTWERLLQGLDHGNRDVALRVASM
jgi:hypothetical protein